MERPVAPVTLEQGFHQWISVHGAREHNLKNLSVEIPRDALVVITGVSGSGKSSLAFDTIYAEGQRRYVESLSAYARQFLDQLAKPDLDSIEGLSPAIAIDQQSTSRNPRSTVGTVTEIYDFLRLLYARIGQAQIEGLEESSEPESLQGMMKHVLDHPVGARLSILSPIVRGRKGIYQKELKQLASKGFTRVRINGDVHALEDEIKLDRQKKHTIEVFVDRLKIKPKIETRLQESLETALELSGGFVRVEIESGNKKPKVLNFNNKLSSINTGDQYIEIEPRLFSFNSPYGACKQCDGLGEKRILDAELLVPDPRKSILEDAVVALEPRFKDYFNKFFEKIIVHYGGNPEKPFEKLNQKIRQALFYGTGSDVISFSYAYGSSRKRVKKAFEGIIPYLERRYQETDRESVRLHIDQFRVAEKCPGCKGARLRQEALQVKIDGDSINQLVELSIDECLKKIESWKLDSKQSKIGERALLEVKERLRFLIDVGLDYLSLDRSVVSLSGGESQRIRLATQIGSELVGVLYVLDEPSIGLHAIDNRKLLKTLRRLRDAGNTVLIVEHDEETIREADYVLDMGPGAGVHGGFLVAQGRPDELCENPKSLTGRYLKGLEKIHIPEKRRVADKFLSIQGASAHNLKKIDVEIPLGVFNCITGVSGSGKSTLIKDTLYNWFRHRLYKSRNRIGEVRNIEGAQQIDKVIYINQQPIGRTPRSNPSTYTGVFSLIRELFSELPEARMRGWRPGRFSFNVKGGRCEECQGGGLKKIEMHFLPDIHVRCEVCNARRYNLETLEVKYRGASISDVLEMTVSESLIFFEKIPQIRHRLQVLNDVGMGYITLGQSATTLSGGESQRMKLAKELSRRQTGKTLYILDEPTTGLHLADICQLLQTFNQLVDQGNTLIVIEHHLDVIKSADYVIDLGPGSGERGGEVVACGMPEALLKVPASATGKCLASILD